MYTGVFSYEELYVFHPNNFVLFHKRLIGFGEQIHCKLLSYETFVVMIMFISEFLVFERQKPQDTG